MGKIAVVTDSNSGLSPEEAREYGIHVLPMPFFINEKLYLEHITLSHSSFYEKMAQDAEISTSQPNPAEVMGLWNNLLKEYDEIVHIPMSSGLSNSCDTANALAMDFDGRVHVVDNQRISVTQLQSAIDAVELAKAGKTGAEIKEILEAEKFDSSIYITLDTLKYLKKGGRITPAAAAIGTVLNLKPVLQIQGEKLDSFAKVRGKKLAKRTMIQAVQKDLETRFADLDAKGLMLVRAAYAGTNEEEALQWKAEIEAAFPGYEIIIYPLSLSVACHIGPGALGIGCVKKTVID